MNLLFRAGGSLGDGADIDIRAGWLSKDFAAGREQKQSLPTVPKLLIKIIERGGIPGSTIRHDEYEIIMCKHDRACFLGLRRCQP